MAAALFASRDQIHFFKDIGYQHDPYTHCPRNKNQWRKGKCSCEPSQSFGKRSFFHLRCAMALILLLSLDYDGYSCMRQWDAFIA
jgi:alpha 1,2-mannosyltransferase